jgi:DMSO/TMAO reductase YedYZ heme-binding membrane subunit
MLHRLIYFSAAAGVIHYIWLAKADLRKPMEHAFMLARCCCTGWWRGCGRKLRAFGPAECRLEQTTQALVYVPDAETERDELAQFKTEGLR